MSKRRRYRNPPVHEVVIDLQFAGPLAVETLQGLAERMQPAFGQGAPIQVVSQQTLLRPRGVVVNRPPDPSLWGWEFETTDPRRITTVSANQLTQHFLRSEDWPRGTYVGWEHHSDSFIRLLDIVAETYTGLEVRRAGVRYVNRVALPEHSLLGDWFTVVPPALPQMEGLWDLTVSRTWSRAVEFPGLSGTVALSKIEPPEREGGLIGVALDIDIFNLYVRDAPSLHDVPGWIENAHRLENAIFEACITEQMAQRFEPQPEEEHA